MNTEDGEDKVKLKVKNLEDAYMQACCICDPAEFQVRNKRLLHLLADVVLSMNLEESQRQKMTCLMDCLISKGEPYRD